MKKRELLEKLLKDQREGKLRDPKFITKIELQMKDEEELKKMYGGAHRWSYSNLSPEQVAANAKESEQAQKEISEIPEHMHDHYKGMRRGGLYMGSKGMGHQAAKDVLNVVMHNPKNLHTAAAILMDRGHNASQARKVLGDIAASHKKQLGE
jgi:hypothetical protein